SGLDLVAARLALDGRAVLVVDNCEQAIAAVEAALREWVRRAPSVLFLATTRHPIAVDGPRTIAVEPLGLDPSAEGHSEGGQLFVERARAVRFRFEPRDDELDVIARIGKRLDGIPLAIELAASLVAVLAPRQILESLDRRFDVLTGAGDPSEERHATLYNV